jgi:yeast amino acid transporter
MSAEKYEPSSDDKHLEGGSPKAATDGYLASTDDRYHFEQSDLDRVQRRLKQRHVQMFVSFAYTLL